MRNFTILTLLFLITCTFTNAQKLNMDLLKGMKPRSIGPAGMSGRVTTIDVVTENPAVMYVGTASGGVWKSQSGGIKWEPVFDDQKTASIGAIAIQQSNPSVIWVGTGEGNPRNSLNGGFGIYKSLDGGKSWIAMGLENTRHIHRVVIDPTNPDVVYVAAIGSPWGSHPERGVYKTTDGGKSWKKILFANNSTGAADLVMDPTNPNKLIAAMWEHQRKPWTFKSGGPGSGLYMTHDGGDTWKKLTEKEGLPKGDLGRIGIAISQSRPNVVYALIESSKNALYRSDDGGFKWNKINEKTDIGNRPFYYSDIYVDPSNENRVYSVFTYVNVSEDGGKNFTQLMPAYGVNNGVHPDHHAWWIHPNDPDFMIDGNDGGLNITRDRGQTWRFIENLPVAQFYHINVDNEFPYNVYGGMQDNGSWSGPAYTLKVQGIRNGYWQELEFGDGFDVVPDPDDVRYGYAMAQEGYLSRYDQETGFNHNIKPTHPDPNVRLRFNWNSPIAQDPFDNNTIYYGSQFVHKSTNKGTTWSVISPDLTSNDPNKQKQDESGGLTMDATGAENHTTLLVIEPSKIEKGLIWTGSDDGQVYITRDGGQNWSNLTANVKGMPSGSWIAQIKASSYNVGEAFMVVNDYRRYNYTPYVFRTKDYGKSWTRIVDGNDVLSYALSIVQDPVEPKLLFLGTDDGLYVTIDGGNQWTKWTAGFPTVSTKDLAIQSREHDLVIGTFGRAAWILDDIRPLREMAKNSNVLNNELNLFDPPVAYQTIIQQAPGTRFGGDAMFNGENRSRGAMLTYSIKKPKASEEKKSDDDKDKKENPYDSVTFTFYKGDELIRTISVKTPEEEGINRFYWRMREKGVSGPSRTAPTSKSEPGGVPVLPGKYKVKIAYGNSADSTELEVKYDPRFDVSTEGLKDRYDALKRIEGFQLSAEKAVTRLRKSKEIADDFNNRLSKADKEKFKEQLDRSKAIADSVTALIDLFIGKEDKRQGITLDYNQYVTDRIAWANWYTGNQMGSPTSTEEALIKIAEEAVNTEIEKVNKFFDEEWKAYKEEMEKVTISPFEALEELK